MAKKYLDSTGLSTVWQKIKDLTSTKADKIHNQQSETILLTNYTGIESGDITVSDNVKTAISKLDNKIPSKYVESINNNYGKINIKTINNQSIIGTGNLTVDTNVPIATESIIGGIKEGFDIKVDAYGNVTVISGANHTHTSDKITIDNYYKSQTGPIEDYDTLNTALSKLEKKIESVEGIIPEQYVLPTATQYTLGGVKSGGDITVNRSGLMNLNTTNLKQKAVTSINGSIGDITLASINGNDIVGNSNIVLNYIEDAPSNGNKYVRQNNNWVQESIVDTSNFATKSEISDMLTKTEARSTYATISQLNNKQDKLVNGFNIKTINGNDLLGFGNISIDTNYDLPIADATTLGGVKEGGDINVDSYGVMTINTSSISNKVVTSVNGQYGDVTIDSSYTLPVADTTTLGGVKEGGDIDIDSNGAMTLNAVKLSEKAIVSISNRAFKEPLCGHIILADIDGKAILGDSENPPTDIVLPKSGGDIDVDESGLMTINTSKLDKLAVTNIYYPDKSSWINGLPIAAATINGEPILGSSKGDIPLTTTNFELPGRYTGSGLNKGVVFGDYSRNTAGKYTIANGIGVNASGAASFASGQTITSTGIGSLSVGVVLNEYNNRTNKHYTAMLGSNLYCNSSNQLVTGTYNLYNNVPYQDKFMFMIGNGTSTTRTNIFTISGKGNVKAKGTISGSQADYAEMFEWEDGNINNEDRVGYFVTLDGEKIVKATTSDNYILGIVSSTPQIIGNEPMDWHNKYLTDDWGRIIYKDTEIEDPITGEITIEQHPIQNPNFDPNKEYINRIYRKEWAPIGMLGQLYVRQDGTLKEKYFCKPNDEGIATYSENSGYYVIKIINENIAKVIFK